MTFTFIKILMVRIDPAAKDAALAAPREATEQVSRTRNGNRMSQSGPKMFPKRCHVGSESLANVIYEKSIAQNCNL